MTKDVLCQVVPRVAAWRGGPCGAILPAMSEPEQLQLTLDLPDVGGLRVIWAPEDQVWFWQLENAQGQILQGGMNLRIAGEHSATQAMRVLLQFVLSTADSHLADFYGVVTVWARINRAALAKALTDLPGLPDRD